MEETTRSGKQAVDRFNLLIEVMAETRQMELEITSGMLGAMCSDDQQQRMKDQIERLRGILSGQGGEWKGSSQ